MADYKTLRIFRDGRRFERLTERKIPRGAKGNLETLAEMKKIVLADSEEKDLARYVFREIIGLEKQTLPERIGSIYEFCRDQIIYENEQTGKETVSDLWSCIYADIYAKYPNNPAGDCVVKSVCLATCFSYLNLKPYFVAIGQLAGVDFYNHVYVACEIDGAKTIFDATPPEFQIGDEAESLRRIEYTIFD